MKSFIIGAAIASVLIGAGFAPGMAADMGGMPMKGAMSAPVAEAYRFELVGTPKTVNGKSTVSVRLLHTTDNKPVVGAIIIQSRADMAPIGMAAMTAPIKALPSTAPGIYSFEIANGGVWNKPDKWALTFAAKVQGEAQTVQGSVIVQLSP